MSKVICISDSYPLHPRLKKLGEFFGDQNEVSYILWNRSEKLEKSPSMYIYHSLTGYGNKINKLKGIPNFVRFINKILRKEKPEIIICRHWQTFFIVSFLNISGAQIIYDVCDMPTNKIIKMLESYTITRASKVILASRFYEEFYTHKNILVLENRPKRNMLKRVEKKECFDDVIKDKLRITFLGKIRYYDIMVNLINSLGNSALYEINFFGDGPDYNILKKYCETNSIKNVEFFGSYKPEDINQIYANTDLVWCAYPSHNFNVKYAISNKFYETLAFQKPGIFSNDTKIAGTIKKNNIGFLIDPYSVSEIKKLFNKISGNPSIIEEVSMSIDSYNESIFWDDYLEKYK